MRWMSMPAALVVAALSTACAYTNPVQPAQTTSTDPTIPFAVTMGSLSGTGTQAGTVSITARVQNASGAPLSGVVVAFSATSGAVAPTNVATGASGTATTTFTGASESTSTVSATVNGLTAKSIVAVPPSTSGSTPAPGAQTPSAILNVSASATTGVPLTFTVSSAATGATWNWSFGDGATAQSTAFSTTHTYGRPGTYAASVSSSATTAGNAIVTVTDPAAGPAAPSAALGTTMSCNAVSPTACNISATFAGAPLASTATSTTWDWGDGTTTLTPTNVGVHTYPQAGSFTVIATTTYTPPGGTLQTARASQSVTVTAAAAPPTLPTPVVSVSCGTVTAPNPTTCNVSATLGGAAIPSASITITAWDWGDGTTGATGTGAGFVNQSKALPASGASGHRVVVSATVPGGSGAGTGTGTAVVQ